MPRTIFRTMRSYAQWSSKRDGASLICRTPLEEATDINFFVGRGNKSSSSEPGSSNKFQYKNAVGRGAFRVPQEDGKTDKSELLLEGEACR